MWWRRWIITWSTRSSAVAGGPRQVQAPIRGRGQSTVMSAVEAVGVEEVGARTAVAVDLPARGVADMADNGRWLEADLPASPPGPPAPLQVLGIHEEPVVE